MPEEEVDWVWRIAQEGDGLDSLGVAILVMSVLCRHVCKPKALHKELWLERLSVLTGFVYGSAVGAMGDTNPVGEKLSPEQVVKVVTIICCLDRTFGMPESLWREKTTNENLIRLVKKALESKTESVHILSELRAVLLRLEATEDEENMICRA